MTKCIRPGEISDEDLLGYASGERRPDVVAHLRDCERCAGLAEWFAAAERALGRRLFRFDCPSGMELGEYQLGLLAASTRARVEAHLARCPHCTAELAAAADFLDEPAAPVAPTAGTLGEIKARVRRVVAQLVSPPQPALALRGAQPASLVYTAGDLTITLQPLQPAPGQVQLLGFVEHEEAALATLAGATVRLMAGETPADSTAIDEHGNFVVGPVPAGTYDLEVMSSTVWVLIPALQLAMQP